MSEMEEKSILRKAAYECNRKGLFLFGAQRYREALECFDKSISLNPNYADAYFCKGYVLGVMGELERGLDAYDKALEVYHEGNAYPKNTAIESCVAKGKLLERLGKERESRGSFREAINRDPVSAIRLIHSGVFA